MHEAGARGIPKKKKRKKEKERKKEKLSTKFSELTSAELRIDITDTPTWISIRNHCEMYSPDLH